MLHFRFPKLRRKNSLKEGERVILVPIQRIHQNPFQPRRIFEKDSMCRLKASIRIYGVIVPVILRQAGKDHYTLISGERRWRACRDLGLKEIPALVKTLDDQTALDLSLVENMMRQNLSEVEEAESLKRLKVEFRNWKEEDLSRKFALTPEQNTRLHKLERLPIILKQAIYAGLIKEDHALLLEPLQNKSELQDWIARIARDKPKPDVLADLLQKHQSVALPKD